MSCTLILKVTGTKKINLFASSFYIINTSHGLIYYSSKNTVMRCMLLNKYG